MQRRAPLSVGLGLLGLALLLTGCDLWSDPLTRHEAKLRDVAPMDEERFWTLIDQANQGNPQNEDRFEALVEVLQPLSEDEMAAFKVRFAERVNALGLADLYAAFQIVQNGPATESFHIYREKIVATGRARFEEVLNDYESILQDANLYLIDMEGIGFVDAAEAAWAQKSGNPKARLNVRLPPLPEFTGPAVDLGDLKAVQQRFPKIWEYDQQRHEREKKRDFGG